MMKNRGNKANRSAPVDSRIESLILDMLAKRDPVSSTCPSEVARAAAEGPDSDWRELMPHVRRIAAMLARQQIVLITRGTTSLQSDQLEGGPIRLRRGPRFGG